jgi:hypothetical protein
MSHAAFFALACAICVFGAVAFTPIATSADLVRRGPEFQINEVPMHQPQRPLVVPLRGRHFMALWDERDTEGQFGVFGRIIDDEAHPAGPVFQINSTGPGDGVRAAVAPTGLVLVVWGSQYRLVGQRFDAEGKFVGSEFTIVGIDEAPEDPAVSPVGDGEFVAIWGGRVFGMIGVPLRSRRVTSDGGIPDPPFLLDRSRPSAWQVFPSGAGLPTGQAVVVWYEENFGELVAHFLEADGPSGTRISIGREADGRNPQACALDAESFIVAWQGRPRGARIQYRIFSVAGVPLTDVLEATPEVAPDPNADPGQSYPTLACLGSANFVLVWQDYYTVYGRVFADEGQTDLRIRVSEPRIPGSPALAHLGGGEFVATWLECLEDSDECDFHGQRFVLGAERGCTGDCDGDGVVAIHELIAAVGIALSGRASDAKKCLAADPDLDYAVSIGELVDGVVQAVEGCHDAT